MERSTDIALGFVNHNNGQVAVLNLVSYGTPGNSPYLKSSLFLLANDGLNLSTRCYKGHCFSFCNRSRCNGKDADSRVRYPLPLGRGALQTHRKQLQYACHSVKWSGRGPTRPLNFLSILSSHIVISFPFYKRFIYLY